ncbi:MAG TPA: ABC transporter substrate-binding protein [Solirubrobacterales bacterium]|nr:ABC transporter substrate-binding protein [Solirubrobacterales bacterium]
MTRTVTAVAVLVAALAVAACGSGGGGNGGDRFDLALDFYVNPDHAGIYTALENGYFEDAGLDVRPQVPSDPSAPIKQVAAGRVDLAISYEPEVVLARDQGLDVIAVAALVNGPLTSLISLPEAGIESAADLTGKTVVTAGIPYQAAYLETILNRAGVDPDSVDQVDVGFNLMQPLIAGRADAMFGGFLNVEGVDLAERGLDPRVVPVDRLGVPTYDELVLVADGDRLRDDPEPIRDFLAALERGTYAAARDPQAATDALVAAGNGLDPELTRAEVDRTLPRLLPPGDMPYGWMDPKRWQRFADYLYDAGQVETGPNAADLLTNALLPPAQGPG